MGKLRVMGELVIGGFLRLKGIGNLVPMGMLPFVGENPPQSGDDGLIVDADAEFPAEIEGAPIDVHRAQYGSAAIGQDQFGFLPYFGDVWRGLVSPVLLYRGDTHCYTESASHASTPPPLLPALHVPHHDRCCDAPPEPRDRAIPRPPPQSGTATRPPLPGRGRPSAPGGPMLLT